MGVLLHRCHSWPQVSQHLAEWISHQEFGVFEVPRLVTGSPGAARLISQELASVLPTGIAAGIEFMSLRQWVHTLTEEHDAAHELQPWHRSRLPLHVWQEVDGLAASGQHPALTQHLGTGQGQRPRRPIALARRVSRLLRTYLDETPEMVESWLEGRDVDHDGAALPTHHTWQPALLRQLVETLGSNPLQAHAHMVESLRSHHTPPVGIVGLAHVPEMDRRLIQAAALGQEVPVWHLSTAAAPDWTGHLQVGTTTACDPPEEPLRPRLEIHGSHDEARQVQVLRDALTHAFQADPTLEPRHVVVLTPDVQRWAPYLRETFAPSDDAMAHPGRTLRLEAPGHGLLVNEVLECMVELLALGESRATGPDLLRLLLRTPIAHRWRFDHERLVRLLEDAEVRWGLDAAHRRANGLGEVTQNTWTRGVDRLLLSVALGGQDAELDLLGVATTSTTDVATIGALSEVLSRIRRFVGISSQPATSADWASRLLELCGDVMQLPWEDTWMLANAQAMLTEFAASTRGVTAALTRSQFTGLFQELVADAPGRARVGNGAIHLVVPGELHPVSHKVVALLGVSDTTQGPDPDDVSGHTAGRRSRFTDMLLAQARSAHHVIIVYPSRTQTNAERARPTTLDRLVERLTGETGELAITHHATSARDPAEFGAPASFDAAAALVLNGRSTATTAHGGLSERRRRAMALPDQPAEHDPLRPHEIVSFLRDTAAAFLRHAAGLRLYDDPKLSSEIPVEASGLEEWSAQQQLLGAAMKGTQPDDAIRRGALSETLPPGGLGRTLMRKFEGDVHALWDQARQEWEQPVEQHQVDVEDVRGTISTRGGRVVVVTPSTGARVLLAPWVELLCLSAMGTATSAHIHHMTRHRGDKVPEATVLQAPDQEEARHLLRRLVETVHVGRHRLIPLPLVPALKLLEEIHSGTFNASTWAVGPEDWDSPWGASRRGASWSLFYDGPADELFSAEQQARDRLPDAGMCGAFGGWAKVLLEPMVQARRMGTP